MYRVGEEGDDAGMSSCSRSEGLEPHTRVTELPSRVSPFLSSLEEMAQIDVQMEKWQGEWDCS